MKKVLLATVILLALVGSGFAIIKSQNDTPQKAYSSPVVQPVKPSPPTPKELLKYVNQERAKSGIAPLRESALLDKSAQWKADDEVRYAYFGHVKPGAEGNNGLDYLDSLNPPCVDISENLHESSYLGQSAESVIESLNTSPAHRKAMVNPKYTSTGFGINGTQIVEHFCQPR